MWILRVNGVWISLLSDIDLANHFVIRIAKAVRYLFNRGGFVQVEICNTFEVDDDLIVERKQWKSHAIIS